MPLNNQRVETASVRLLAADAVRILLAAPGAGKFNRVIGVDWSSITSAAQPVPVTAGAGGPELFALGASLGVSSGNVTFGDGYDCPENTTLVADPPAAGPEISFVVKYQIVTFK